MINKSHSLVVFSKMASFLFAACLFGSPYIYAQPAVSGKEVHFTKHIITNDFISEGVAVADVNKDGKIDIIAGAYWFEAPAWTKHMITSQQQYDPATAFSNSFLNFALDVDQDGWIDQVRISLPGEEVVWYQNPGTKPGYWTMHLILTNAGNESPAFADVDGDGRPDIVCNDPVSKEMLWMKSPAVKGDTVWKKYLIASGETGTNRYTHGLGWIDMNGDGRKDVVITKGWWQCPPDPTQPNWQFHATGLGEDCSQLFALPSNTSAAPVLVSSSAHNYGIWWHEPVPDEKGNTAWKHHIIFDKFSQTHGLALADINNDGHPDLVTGKRYFAHNGTDPGALEPAVLYWFEYKPGKIPLWIPHEIDNNSGVGLQVVVQDINKDGRTDIVVCNKKGLFFFEQAAK